MEAFDKPILNSGLIFEVEQENDYVGGFTPLDPPPILFEDGHGWAKNRLKEEMQFNRNFDSFSCVTFASLKALLMQMKYVYGVDLDLSESFTAVMSGTVPGQGNSVRNVMESIRKDGGLPESYRPLTENTTQAQFFAGVSASLKRIAQSTLLKDYDIHWEQLAYSGNVDHALLKENLKYLPNIVTGYAWAYDGEVYRDYGKQANHCFLNDDFDGDILIANDSYPQDNQFDDNSNDSEFIKRLAPNFRIWSAHRIWATPKANVNTNLLTHLKKMFDNLQSYMDDHGLHIWYVEKRGKQEIPLTTMAEKALFMSYTKEGIIKTTTYAKLSTLPNFSFF